MHQLLHIYNHLPQSHHTIIHPTPWGDLLINFTADNEVIKSQWVNNNPSPFSPLPHHSAIVLTAPTQFQIDIISTLLDTSMGATISYKQLSEIANHPNASRATGQILAHNEIALYIPCHRVINSNGKIGNYRWDKSRKIQILQFEQECRKSQNSKLYM